MNWLYNLKKQSIRRVYSPRDTLQNNTRPNICYQNNFIRISKQLLYGCATVTALEKVVKSQIQDAPD